MDIFSTLLPLGSLGFLMSPPVLFFVLGALVAAARAELPFPAGFGKALAGYLIIAIGLKGGVALSAAEGLAGHVPLLLVAAALSFLLPVIAYMLLRGPVGLDRINAAAVAAHYGSVSLVTFVAAAAFLETQGIAYGGYMVAVLALMEAPAIIVGLILAGRGATATGHGGFGPVLREAGLNGSVLLLLGAVVIGWIIGQPGHEKLAPVFVAPWDGVLSLFLLEMGYLAMARLRDAGVLPVRLVGFGLVMPLIGATIGLFAGSVLLSLADGDLLLLMVLCASASYIAVPAALRTALPSADPAISIPLALAITFPFNLTIGIPLYYSLVAG